MGCQFFSNVEQLILQIIAIDSVQMQFLEYVAN